MGDQVPGLAEILKLSAAASCGPGRVKTEHFPANDGFHGNDIPGIVGDYIGREKVDVVGGVEAASVAVAANAKIDEVSAAMRGESRFDLDTEQAISGSDHEIESHAIAVWLAHAESEAGGFEDEDQFRDFAFALGISGLASGLGAADRARVGEFTVAHELLTL